MFSHTEPRFRPAARTALLGGLLALISCTTGSPPVAVEGNPQNLRAVAGRWEGEYSGGPKGRQGKIVFEFNAESAQGAGQVWMEPRGGEEAEALRERPAGEAPAAPRPLRIEVIRVAEGRVSGRLEPYWDPDCNCEARTTFEGRIRGNKIEGEFSASTATLPVGRWKVVRVKSFR